MDAQWQWRGAACIIALVCTLIVIVLLAQHHTQSQWNARAVATTCTLESSVVTAEQCSYECNCYQSCTYSTDADGDLTRHCSRHCDTCYRACFRSYITFTYETTTSLQRDTAYLGLTYSVDDATAVIARHPHDWHCLYDAADPTSLRTSYYDVGWQQTTAYVCAIVGGLCCIGSCLMSFAAPMWCSEHMLD